VKAFKLFKPFKSLDRFAPFDPNETIRSHDEAYPKEPS